MGSVQQLLAWVSHCLGLMGKEEHLIILTSSDLCTFSLHIFLDQTPWYSVDLSQGKFSESQFPGLQNRRGRVLKSQPGSMSEDNWSSSEMHLMGTGLGALGITTVATWMTLKSRLLTVK